MLDQPNDPGFLVVTPTEPGGMLPDVAGLVERFGLTGASIGRAGATVFATWGLGSPTPGRATALSGTSWSDTGLVGESSLAEQLTAGEDDRLRSMLPPFAAFGVAGDALVIASDGAGFRQVFSRRRDQWMAWSTSARLLAGFGGAEFRKESLFVQSLVGWQLGEHTLYQDVVKLEPGECVTISARGIERRIPEAETIAPATPAEAIHGTAAVLRSLSEQYLDEYPDPTLQLTGGLDSRLILSAIDAKRRRGLHVMTIGAADHPDVVHAAALAARYGMRHTVVGLEGLDRLTPAESFDRACSAAARLDGMVDPIAKAVTLWAEDRIEQGPRVGGAGGEIARGFFYIGKVHDVPVTSARVARMTTWRMFANEAVDPQLLVPELASEARPYAVGLVHRILRETGLDWFRATDVLYGRHRMPRWAGLNESIVCFDRQLINPLMHHQFWQWANRLAPKEKAHARYFSRLLVTIDRELAGIPLDGGRPSPAVLASGSLPSQVTRLTATAKRAARKVKQRLTDGRRPAVGTAVFTAKVAEHIRSTPDALDPLRGQGIVSDAWLDDVSTGRISPSPASLAFVINLLASNPAQ